MAADLIFTGGRIYTVLPDERRDGPGHRPWRGGQQRRHQRRGRHRDRGRAARARGGGDRRPDHRRRRRRPHRRADGPSPEAVRLGGRALLPGFQDAHVHPAFTGSPWTLQPGRRRTCTTRWPGSGPTRGPSGPGVDQRQRLADGVVRPAAPLQPNCSTRRWDRPAYLTNRDPHGAWVNSAALAVAGLDRPDPGPADGRIEREPTVIRRAPCTRARHAGRRPCPRPPLAERLPGCCWPSSTCTPWASPPGRTPSWGSTWAPRTRCRPTWPPPRDGTLTARVEGALWWDRNRGGEQLDDLLDRRSARPGGPVPGAGASEDHAGWRRGELHRRDDRPLPG